VGGAFPNLTPFSPVQVLGTVSGPEQPQMLDGTELLVINVATGLVIASLLGNKHAELCWMDKAIE